MRRALERAMGERNNSRGRDSICRGGPKSKERKSREKKGRGRKGIRRMKMRVEEKAGG